MPPNIQQTDDVHIKGSTHTATEVVPVADGTYTVGLKLTGGGTNGTITVEDGIITAIQQAT